MSMAFASLEDYYDPDWDKPCFPQFRGNDYSNMVKTNIEDTMKKRIYVDLDDTLCNFFGKAALAIINNPGIQYPQSQYDFFRTLEPIYGAIEGIKLLATKYDVHILTRPSIRNPLCYTEKAMWVYDNLGFEWMDKLHISCDKSLFIGDYLIDDVPWPQFKGKQLQFGTSEFPNWQSIINYFFLN